MQAEHKSRVNNVSFKSRINSILAVYLKLLSILQHEEEECAGRTQVYLRPGDPTAKCHSSPANRKTMAESIRLTGLVLGATTGRIGTANVYRLSASTRTNSFKYGTAERRKQAAIKGSRACYRSARKLGCSSDICEIERLGALRRRICRRHGRKS